MEKIDQLVAELALNATVVKPALNPFKLSFIWATATVLYLLISLSISGVRVDLLDKIHQFWFAAELFSLLGIYLATTLSAALLGFPDQYQKHNLALAPIGMFALFVVILFFAWHADIPPAPLPTHSFQCTLGITLMALIPGSWTFYLMRNYACVHYRLAGSVAVLSAFSVGALWLRLHEATDSIIHVVEWHYLPMLLISVVGLWMGKLLLKW